MTKNTMNVAKGIGIGMLSGAAALAVGSAVMKKSKPNMKGMKRSAGKAVHTVSELINGVESMLH
ncbi:MAG: hypothetical protein RSC76_05920 [Oscillospiraceae bacterium]